MVLICCMFVCLFNWLMNFFLWMICCIVMLDRLVCVGEIKRLFYWICLISSLVVKVIDVVIVMVFWINCGWMIFLFFIKVVCLNKILLVKLFGILILKVWVICLLSWSILLINLVLVLFEVIIFSVLLLCCLGLDMILWWNFSLFILLFWVVFWIIYYFFKLVMCFK